MSRTGDETMGSATRGRTGRLLALALVASAGAWLATGCADGGGSAGEGEAVEGDVASEAGPEPWTDELAAELRAMGREDQAVREGFGPASVSDTAFMGRMARTDSARSRRLRELVERHGWPRTAEVGEEAAGAAFLVVQHTPFTDWQREMLPEVRAAVEAGELDPQSFALLYDRVQVGAGRPQRYGTQLDQGPDGRLQLEPLEDTAAVDSLRGELGLPPLAVYFDVLEEAMGMEVAREGLPVDTAGGS